MKNGTSRSSGLADRVLSGADTGRLLSEFAVPRDKDRQAIWYHGTPQLDDGLKAFREGIKPKDILLGRRRSRSFTAPVPGRVYLTKDIGYALIYGLGMNAAGESMPDDFLEVAPNGAILEIPGDRLTDIQPDEDIIGKLAGEAIRKPGVRFDWLADLAGRILTPAEFSRVGPLHAGITWEAKAGKKLVRRMTAAQMYEIIDAVPQIAAIGVVRPVRVWRVDKYMSMDFRKDGSNFFDLSDVVAGDEEVPDAAG